MITGAKTISLLNLKRAVGEGEERTESWCERGINAAGGETKKGSAELIGRELSQGLADALCVSAI